jgi:hypothetical protein
MLAKPDSGVQVLENVKADKGISTIASFNGIVLGGNFRRVDNKDIRFVANFGGQQVSPIGLGMQVCRRMNPAVALHAIYVCTQEAS